MREAVATLRRVCFGTHPDTMTALNNLGVLLEQQGRLSEAEPLLREAHAGRQVALGAAHEHTRDTAAALERVHRAQEAQARRDAGRRHA